MQRCAAIREGLDSTDIAYLAGYLDADGSFMVRTTNSGYTLRVTATGTDERFMSNIAMLMSSCASYLAGFSVSSMQGSSRKDQYTVYIQSVDGATTLCAALMPYLRLKRDRASVLLAIAEHIKNKPHYNQPARNDDADKLCVMLTKMNKRGRQDILSY